MNIKKILSIILVIIWMITIFYFSHQQGTGSSGMSKKVSTVIVNIVDIKNEMIEEQKEAIVAKIEPIIRKLAHYTIYIIGGILITNCAYVLGAKEKKAILYSAIIGVIYASSDEIHQLFVDGRSGRVADVAIDSLGIFTGIAVYLIIRKIAEAIVNRKKRVI